jgi:hypothetical protein
MTRGIVLQLSKRLWRIPSAVTPRWKRRRLLRIALINLPIKAPWLGEGAWIPVPPPGYGGGERHPGYFYRKRLPR